MLYNELNKDINYISIFNSTKSNLTVGCKPFIDYINELYITNKQIYLKDGKNSSLIMSQGIYSLNNNLFNITRSLVNIKRWNGIIVIDCDIDKKIKEDYLTGINTQLIKTVDNVISELFNYFKRMDIIVKYSSSGAGLHAFFVINNSHLSDSETLDVHYSVFKYFERTIQQQIDNILNNLKCSYLNIKIDDRFETLTQPISLAKTKKIHFADRVFAQSFLNDFFDEDSDKYIKREDKPIFNSVDYSIDEISEIKKVMIDLIDNIKPNSYIEGWNNRNATLSGLVLLDFDKSIIPKLNKYDRRNRNEYEGYYNSAFSKYKSGLLETSFIKTAYLKLKHISSSILTYPFEFENNNVVNEKREIEKKKKEDNCLTVDIYLDEVYDDIKNVIDNEGKVILQAPTGGGKTFVAIRLLREMYKNNPNGIYVMACDTIMLATQIATQEKLNNMCGNTSHLYTKPLRSGIYVSTYDSIKHFDVINFLIVDEAHQLIASSVFRNTAVNILNKVINKTKTLLITATPHYMYPYHNDFKYIGINVTNRVKNNYVIVDTTGEDLERAIIKMILNNRIENGNKGIVYINSTNTLRKIKEYFTNQFPEISIVIINKDVKNTEKMIVDEIDNDVNNISEKCLNSILEKNIIPDNVDIVLTTCLLQNGINIKNENIEWLMMDETEETAVIQFSARFRKGVNGNIYLLKTAENQTWMVEKDIVNYNYEVKLYQQKCDTYNGWQKDKVEETILNQRIKGIFYNDVLEKWQINKLQIAYMIYEENRKYFMANPKTFFKEKGSDEEVQILDLGTVKDVVDKDVYKDVLDYYKEIAKSKRKWYFEDDNCKIINKILKNTKDRWMTDSNKNFYEENKDYINDITITMLNNRFYELKKMLKDLDYIVDFEIFKTLLKESENLWVYSHGIIFNYLYTNLFISSLLDNKNEIEKIKEKAKKIKDSISVTNNPKFHLLLELKQTIKHGTYTWNELVAIFTNIYNSEKYYKFRTEIGKSINNNLIKDYLTCIFTINTERKMIITKSEIKDIINISMIPNIYKIETIKEKRSVTILSEYKIDDRFTDIFKTLDKKYDEYVEIKSEMDLEIFDYLFKN